MSIKKLFLSHYNRNAGEVAVLAEELRLRGIVPWVDKGGGFQVADECECEARRAIREDCFGLLLYATKDVFTRRFIRDVEIDEAIKARGADPSFDFFAVPRGIGFADLARLSTDEFGVDLSAFHTTRIPTRAALPGISVQIAAAVLDKVLRRAGRQHGSRLSLQFSTRELMPDAPEDVLRIDATGLFRPGSDDPAAWERLLKALRDVKAGIARTYGRPCILVNGSKHLSAAFLLGRVFAPFALDIRQTPNVIWASDSPPAPDEFLTATVSEGDGQDRRLFVQIATRYKNLAAGVDALLCRQGGGSPVRLNCYPAVDALNVDSASVCRSVADQVYRGIERIARRRTISEVHLFAAVPQAMMVMLGQQFRGVPPVHLYEWLADQGEYRRCWCVPAGVL